MLDKSATYHKSAKGAEAVATRDRGLSPRQRSMLILVNGRRSFAELARLAQVLGDPEQLLLQLEQQGLIETGPPRAGPPSLPAPLDSSWGAVSAPAPLTSAPAPLVSAPAPLGPDDLQVPLARAQRFAIDRLKDLLGPEADDLCERIAAADSAPAFRAEVRRTETVLRSVVGPELALQFTRAVETQRK
jgi:hypothetical protein